MIRVRFGSRGSALALWQTRHVAALLQSLHPGLRIEFETIRTQGDQILDKALPLIGGKGLFTAELEAALHAGTIDCAVHSLKDLPTEMPPGLAIAAVPARVDPADALVSRQGYRLATLPQGAKVGTSSTRRGAQLLLKRPDLQLLDIRGNVDTRIRKALDPDGPYDAILLARAGLERLERLDVVSETIALDNMLPAPGQGALAVQTRAEPAILELFAPLQDWASLHAVTAERAFLAHMGGGCAVPIAAHGEWRDGHLNLRGRICSPDGRRCVEVTHAGAAADAGAVLAAGEAMARDALARGAAELLREGP